MLSSFNDVYVDILTYESKENIIYTKALHFFYFDQMYYFQKL